MPVTLEVLQVNIVREIPGILSNLRARVNPAYSLVPALLRRIRRFHTFYFVLSLEYKCVALDVYTSYNVVKLTCYNNIHNIHKFLEFYVIKYFSISGVIGEVTIFDHHVGTLTIKI